MNAMENLLPKNLDELSPDALRTLVQQQAAVLAYKDKTIKELELTNSKLKHELAVIRRYRFGQKSEQYSGTQGLLFEEDTQADLVRSEEHTSELQSRGQLVCRLLLEKKNRSAQ